MSISPPRDPNAAPLDAIHKRRLMSIAIVLCGLLFLWTAFSLAFSVGVQMIFFGLAGLTFVYVLFLDIQRVEFFPTYISINYVLRQEAIERAVIEFVSMETGTTRSGGIPRTYNYVQMRLRNGRKINFGSFKEGIDAVYQKLKACESTNEEFPRGR
jgi:hypothetical protein